MHGYWLSSIEEYSDTTDNQRDSEKKCGGWKLKERLEDWDSDLQARGKR